MARRLIVTGRAGCARGGSSWPCGSSWSCDGWFPGRQVVTVRQVVARWQVMARRQVVPGAAGHACAALFTSTTLDNGNHESGAAVGLGCRGRGAAPVALCWSTAHLPFVTVTLSTVAAISAISLGGGGGAGCPCPVRHLLLQASRRVLVPGCGTVDCGVAVLDVQPHWAGLRARRDGLARSNQATSDKKNLLTRLFFSLFLLCLCADSYHGTILCPFWCAALAESQSSDTSH